MMFFIDQPAWFLAALKFEKNHYKRLQNEVNSFLNKSTFNCENIQYFAKFLPHKKSVNIII